MGVQIGASWSIRRSREEPYGAVRKHPIDVEKYDFDFLCAIGGHREIVTRSTQPSAFSLRIAMIAINAKIAIIAKK